MCGLTGFWDRSTQANSGAMRRIACEMASTMYRRGPDDSGEWVDEKQGIAFGFRRLAIVDLSEFGHQPMASPSGRYVIAFNGEVYNHAGLRAELEAAGSGPAF